MKPCEFEALKKALFLLEEIVLDHAGDGYWAKIYDDLRVQTTILRNGEFCDRCVGVDEHEAWCPNYKARKP